jgi:RNA-directed DNA polymerase
MTVAPMAANMSPGLLKVVERAKRDPEVRFTSLSHLLDEPALRRAYDRIRKDAAVGVDGITKEQYGQEQERNVRDLHERMRTMRYRHQPIRRVHIPKDKGKTRPIGISCVEDKMVQGALSEVLEAIYEPIFVDGSYGFRRGRSAHDALRALDRVLQSGVGWILEADIVSFFDSIDRTKLEEMLRERVIDGSFLRLIGKCLHVGILDGAEFSEPEVGTVQGSALSPMLGNIYLHHVLDLWFEHDVRPRLRGQAHLIRYADDFVIAFQNEDDAKRVRAVLPQRLGRFGLTLHPDKTRVVPFGRPPSNQTKGKGPATSRRRSCGLSRCRSRRSASRSGPLHESLRRKSRMVEIS